jgi:hypothetical protein
LFVAKTSWSQKTIVEGKVTDAVTGDSLPFVKLQFQDAKIGTISDDNGNYYIETYYATDSLIVYFSGYKKKTVKISKDESQIINIQLETLIMEIGEVFAKAPDELPSTILHKRMVANKDANNREKLDAYEYETYNKLQLDLNNIGDGFTDNKVMKRLDFVLDYLDSTESAKTFLPVLLTETISDFYFKNNPKKKIEVIKAYQVSGTEELQFNQFLGDMYLDINIYDNYVNMFGKSFVSPTANFARSYYRFYLEDSTFIDNQWCYLLKYVPKRTGDLTFTGEMWIHDTTYAVKSFKGNISANANINYIQDMYIEHEFDLVAPEVWMLTEEKMICDVNLSDKSKVYGLYGRKYSSRKNFVINKERTPDFYRVDETVTTQIEASHRDLDYWALNRHRPLSRQEERIDEMVDTLNNNPYFKMLKNLTYLATTGYYVINKIEVGNIFGLFSTNPIESFRASLALRTSNNFSKRIELGGILSYGFGDEKFKYNLKLRANLSRKKRTLLTAYYNYDIQQLGQSPTANAVGSTFGTILRTGPLDKLSFISKFGFNIERDIKKDLQIKFGAEWREIRSLGKANFVRPKEINDTGDTISRLTTAELSFGFRYAKGEEFISGAFDRTSLKSKWPILFFNATIGIKGLLESDYEYQRFDAGLDHTQPLGVFGKLHYGLSAGKIFGKTAYPFLKIHEGNQSYYLITNTFNMLNFYEFISDQYATGYFEQHWNGFFLDRVPGVKKLKWRLVTGVKGTIGSIGEQHSQLVAMPSFVNRFNNKPYLESAIGIENIFKVFRVDMVYRMSHQIPGVSPLGVRMRFAINF